MFKACIFDLDGVIVDTAKYHYVAWRRIANSFKIDFTDQENENLKGVGRMDSLKYILSLGDIKLSVSEMSALAAKKNKHYLELLEKMGDKEILPGVSEFLMALKLNGVKIGLGSASRNAKKILEKVNLTSYFDVIVDGNDTTKGKPDPQVFLMCSDALEVYPEEAVIFEDSKKGIYAAHRGGFAAVGIGNLSNLDHANYVMPDFSKFNVNKLGMLYTILNEKEI